ncbi:MAG: DUF1614 domain-containing protein [Pseudomonadota bacterium]|nr:DUF1614 domain-containing protein [Pseudomonadota bacterium]
MFPRRLLVALILGAAFLTLIEIGVITVAFDKLGLSERSALNLFLLSVLGSMINLPLFSIRRHRQTGPPHQLPPFPWLQQRGRPDRTLIAVNVGGGLIPVMFSVYLYSWHTLPVSTVLIAIAAVSGACYLASRPIPRLGIGMPILVGPLSAAAVAIFTYPENSAPLAYICGTIGVLIGADLLRLPDIGRLDAPVASIGGAGTFDGMFITGLIAVLLT